MNSFLERFRYQWEVDRKLHTCEPLSGKSSLPMGIKEEIIYDEPLSRKVSLPMGFRQEVTYM